MNVSARSAGAKLLLLTLLSAAGLLASATAATVYTAGQSQRRVENRAGRGSSLEMTRHWDPVRALSDSLVKPLGDLAAVDSVTLAAIVGLIAAPDDSAAWISHGRIDSAGPAPLATYRRWARSRPLPPFWGLRTGMVGIADSRALPMPRLVLLKKWSKQNEAAADSALLVGDVATALARARENMSAARHLLWQPTPISALVGRVLMLDGAKLLARSALQADDPSLHSAALRLEAMTRPLQVIPRVGWLRLGSESSDPTDGQLPAIARDRTVHPATRFLAIEVMVLQSCLNTRDVLFGPSAARHVAVDAMLDGVRDIVRVEELRPHFHRTLTLFDEEPSAELTRFKIRPRDDESWTESLLRLVVPRNVQARVDFCRQFGA